MTASDAPLNLDRELVRLVGTQAGVHACMSGLRMAVPLLALQQGRSAAAAGLLLACFGVAQLLVSVPAGRLADRHGLRLPMFMGLLAASLGAGVAAVWPTDIGLAIAALLEGGAIALAVVALQRHAGRLARDPVELRKVFSWVSFTPAASNFVGPFAAGIAIDTLGFQTAFLMLGIGPAVSWLFLRQIRELPQHDTEVRPAAGSRSLWRDPLVRRMLLLNWFVSSTWDVHGVMVPLMGHARGLSASSIGTILGAFAIAVAIARLLMPWLASRMREWTLMALALALSAVLLAFYPFTTSVLTMVACSVFIGAAIGGVQPMVMSLLHQITPPHQHGEAVALRLLMINASSICMPIVAGTVGGLVGVGGIFWAISLSLVLGVRVALGLRRVVHAPRA